jgi:hypothetical protein
LWKVKKQLEAFKKPTVRKPTLVRNMSADIYPFVIFISKTGKSAIPLVDMLMRKVN